MSFRPCFLIPHYNHMHALPATVAGLQRFSVPIFIIDDGSLPSMRTDLQALMQRFSNVHVHWRQENGGKGVAMTDGFRLAAEQGFSHAFQIDADGQHEQSVIPQFLRAAATTPDALISGQPIYDSSVPKARLYGRRITDFWVMIETLSTDIHDAMCGFRIYPLPAVIALIETVTLLPRMDFDTDILVRLFWRDVSVKFLPCRVIYPENGVSHFNLWRDNLRICRMHTRLVLGMLWRLPRILMSKIRRQKSFRKLPS